MKFPETKKEAEILLEDIKKLPRFKRILVLAELVFEEEKRILNLKRKGLLKIKEMYKNDY